MCLSSNMALSYVFLYQNTLANTGCCISFSIQLTISIFQFHFIFLNIYKNCMPLQLVPEVVEAGARVYIKEKSREKNVMIICNKISKGTSNHYKQLQVT